MEKKTKAIIGVIGVISFLIIIVLWVKNSNKNTTITTKTNTINKIKKERDNYRAIIISDSTKKANNKEQSEKNKKQSIVDIRKMKSKRDSLLVTHNLHQLETGMFYWEWNSNPKRIQDGFKQEIGNYTEYYVSFRSDLSYKLSNLTESNSYVLAETIIYMIKNYPNITKSLYYLNKDIISDLKIDLGLSDQGTDLLQYLDTKKESYEDDFEKYYQYHINNETDVFYGDGWDKFKSRCDSLYNIENLSHVYDSWRTVRYNLNAESKAALYEIITDYNAIGKEKAEEVEEIEKTMIRFEDLFN